MGILDDNFRSDLAGSLNYEPIPTKERPAPEQRTGIPPGMNQYKGYFYELADSYRGLGIGRANWTYSIYPPSSSDSAYFDYSQVIRLQDGFSSQSLALADLKTWIDGIIGNTVDVSDTGSADIIDIGLEPLANISETVAPVEQIIPNDPEEVIMETEARLITEDQIFLLVGIGVAVCLITFIQKKGE